MKKIIFYISLLFLISPVEQKMTEEERKILLKKLTKEISLDNLDDVKNLEKTFQSGHLRDIINYDPETIRTIIRTYQFEEEFNYLTKMGITPKVKDQGLCGSCWSFAVTSSLAYRFKKEDIDVDLSPQDGLSCYFSDCETGNYLVDSQLNLAKNGTVTENCLPYSSGDGKIEECPTLCKDSSKLKKYFAQNTYITDNYYSEESFYQIILIMLDQLNNYGPIATGIDVFEDFIYWAEDKEKCSEGIYKYDGVSDPLGGHAMTIVGYGQRNDTFYWIVQNSWGDQLCDNGFLNIEFGQVGIERISFSEPNLKEEGIIPKEIPVLFESLNELCYLEVETNGSYNEWVNTLDITFENIETNETFNHQCGIITIPQKGKQVNCYFEEYNYMKDKGIYKFKSSHSLGSENNFTLDTSFEEKQFNFFGFDTIMPFVFGEQTFYVSEEGSRIIFAYLPINNNDTIIPPLFPNLTSTIALRNCHLFSISFVDIYYCELAKEELDYFSGDKTSDSPVSYNVWCGYKLSTNTIVYKLDKTKYPVFRFKKVFIPESKNITNGTIFYALVDIEGNPENLKKNNYFNVLINYEFNKTNQSYEITCETGIYNKEFDNPKNENKLNCFLILDDYIVYDNIYFLPFYYPYLQTLPYEVIINETIKGETEKSSSNYIKISKILFGLLLLL